MLKRLLILLALAGPTHALAADTPIHNLKPQGTMQGDLDAGGHAITNTSSVTASVLTLGPNPYVLYWSGVAFANNITLDSLDHRNVLEITTQGYNGIGLLINVTNGAIGVKVPNLSGGYTEPGFYSYRLSSGAPFYGEPSVNIVTDGSDVTDRIAATTQGGLFELRQNGDLFVPGPVVATNVHLVTNAPSVNYYSLGAGGSCYVSGNDLGGVVTFTTGSTPPPLNSTLIQVQFGNSFHNTPGVTISPHNPAAAQLTGPQNPYVYGFSNVFTINSGPTALTAGATYQYNYTVSSQ